MRKIITLSLLLFLSVFAASAQDVIVKKNGDPIEGKVIEVGVDRVTYKMDQAENSANFVILKRELSRIEFGNGQTIWLNDRLGRVRTKSARYPEEDITGRHLILVSPFKALDSGPGFGLSYEIQFGKNKNFGFILPLTITLPDASGYMFEFDGGSRAMFYASPGLKIYPFGQRKATYAVGPHLFIGHGVDRNQNYIYDPVTGIYRNTSSKVTLTRAGLIINNYLQFQVTPRFVMGLNAGVGPRYFDREVSENIRYNVNGMQITGEFNFNLGIRF